MDARDPPLVADAAVDDELRAGRPAVDRVRMDAARARAEQALFDVAVPARVGRYVVIDTAGAGAMGIVYRAYDPQLDRRVALKVVQAKGLALEGARERLLGEARALAQLAHPNVVPVHDVVMVGDDLVVVMEFVEGVTLDAWAAEAPRGLPEVLAMYAQAARGLAAAHDVGVIHRDFKPGNALVGTDGRVRVVDFGLARLTVGGDDGAAGAAPITATTAAGTLAYMAPEQLAGEPVTAAVDQFSFWVALYEAAAGRRPFDGDEPGALLRVIRAGKLAAPRPGQVVPAWLRRAAERGLAVSPAARFPTMHQVASELQRVRGWRRWRGPVALAMLAAIASAAVVRAQTAGAPPPPPCDGGVDDIDLAWGDAARTQVGAALARAPGAYAREVEARTLAGLDAYRAGWMDLHRHTCVEHRRGALSTNLLDRSMACLQTRRDQLASAAVVLGELAPAAIDNAIEVVVRLPPVAACGDLVSLAADAPPIADPAVRARVAALRVRLGRATALDAAGRGTEAVAAGRAIATEATALAQPAIVIDAELLIGRSLVQAGAYAPALEVLRQAEELALATGRPAAAVIAAARRIYVEAAGGGAPPELAMLDREVALLEPLSRSVASDPLARPLLFNNLGAAHQAAGRRALTYRDLQAGHAALAAIVHPDPELNSLDLNLALITPDPTRRGELALAAWRRQRAAFGPSHPQTLIAQYQLALLQPDPRLSLFIMSDVCERFAAAHPEARAVLADCTYYRAFWAAAAGDADEARRQYQALLVLTTDDAMLVALHALAAGEVALAGGDTASARAGFAAALAALGDHPPWWRFVLAAHARIGAARVLLTAGHGRDADRLLDEAVALLDDRITRNEVAPPRQLRARALALRGPTRR